MLFQHATCVHILCSCEDKPNQKVTITEVSKPMTKPENDILSIIMTYAYKRH